MFARVERPRSARGSIAWSLVGGVIMLLLTFGTAVTPAAAAPNPPSGPMKAPRTAVSSSAVAPPGQKLQAKVSSHPRRYTSAQLKTLNRRLLESDDMEK